MWFVILLVVIIVAAVVIKKYMDKAEQERLEREKAEKKKRAAAAAKAKKQKYGKITEVEKNKLLELGGEDLLTVTSDAFHKAENGNNEAMLFMGLTYNLKLKNPVKSFYWMERASNAGNLQAKYHLGTYYGDGYGVTVDRMHGTSLILYAAQRGNQDAIDFCKTKMNLSKEELRSAGISV